MGLGDVTPRSVRNYNPGNICSGPAWKGLQPVRLITPEQEAEPRFAVFQNPVYGFRALVLLLINYGHDGLETIHQIIARYAPTTENDTEAYVSDVSRRTGFAPNQPLDLSDRSTLFAIAKAIATHETGGWSPYWTDAQLSSGLDWALSGVITP